MKFYTFPLTRAKINSATADINLIEKNLALVTKYQMKDFRWVVSRFVKAYYGCMIFICTQKSVLINVLLNTTLRDDIN